MSLFGHKKIIVLPLIMGSAMGLMMLWMLHGAITGGGVGLWAGVMFVGVHIAVIAAVIAGSVFAARMSPRVRGFLARMHRPSPRHMGAMMTSAALTMAVIHFVAHGSGGLS